MKKSNAAYIDGVIGIVRQQGKKKPIINIYHNTMNEHAQNVLLGLSASLLLNGASPTPFNRLCFTTPGMHFQSEIGTSNNKTQLQYYDPNNPDKDNLGLTALFLKLDDDELAALNSGSKYLPIKDANGNLSSKVVAYGTFKTVNAVDKTGIITFSDESRLVEPYSCANAWLFEADKYSFEYNVIAIASLDSLNTFASYKCISRVDLFGSGNEITKNFIAPGFTGITGANEVLLNYNQDGVSRWRYNLKTGKTTAVESNEAAYNIDMTNVGNQQVVLDGKLYSLRSGNYGYPASYVDVFDSTGALLKSITISTTNYRPRGLFTDGTDVYISVTKVSTSASITASMLKINQSTYATTVVKNSAFTGWANLPDGFDIDVSSYIKASYIVNNVRYYVVGDYDLDVQFICSDIMNVKTSIVAEAPIFDCVVSVDNTPEGVYFICGGTKTTSAPSAGAYNERTISPMLPLNKIRNSDNTDYLNTTFQSSGVWVNNNSYANFLSFEKYDTLQSKTIAQNFTLTYGYEIGIR